MMDQEQLRDYAERMYYEFFKPQKCEDEWYYAEDWSVENGTDSYWINIFKWDDGPTTFNIYEGPDADHLELIFYFTIQDQSNQ